MFRISIQDVKKAFKEQSNARAEIQEADTSKATTMPQTDHSLSRLHRNPAMPRKGQRAAPRAHGSMSEPCRQGSAHKSAHMLL